MDAKMNTTSNKVNIGPRFSFCLHILSTSRTWQNPHVKALCTSANVILPRTLHFYIDETGRRLADRFREHLRNVERNDMDASKPVARHSNLLYSPTDAATQLIGCHGYPVSVVQVGHHRAQQIDL